MKIKEIISLILIYLGIAVIVASTVCLIVYQVANPLITDIEIILNNPVPVVVACASVACVYIGAVMLFRG